MHFPVFTSHTRTVSSYDPDTCGEEDGIGEEAPELIWLAHMTN